MASCEDYFSRCQTTPDVHNKLMTLLVCDFLKPEDASLRFRMNCRSHVTPAVRETASVERYLNYLEEKGEFREGNYDFIKQKVEEINVAITDLIIQAERKIEEIRENSLKVETIVTDVEPTSLEEETQSRVTAILLSVSEILICKSNDPNIEIRGLWDRYRDYQILSYDFLSIWHTEYCTCQKRYGQQMLLQFLKFGADKLESGQIEYDYFRSEVVPSLWITLKESVKCTCHMMQPYRASQVSVARSCVLSYWIFDRVTNLDKFWRTYEEGGLHVELQDCFNTEEALRLLKVDRISLKMTILESDYLKYRSILEKKAPKDHRLASRLQTLDLKRGGFHIPSDLMDLMKKRLYETPTVLSYLLQSVNKMTIEPLYASVSLLEYDNERHWLHSRHSTKIENIPDQIFCTSDEYLWKGRRSSISESIYRIQNTNSTIVLILGEAGCGKTSYCKHLLRQWYRGEDLQKFDHVFYIDTSVLQTSKRPISFLVSSAVLGNVFFSGIEVDIVLRNEKCLILIDGDENFRGSLLREYEIEKSTMEYRNCVFVFLMRPLHLMRAKLNSFKILEVNVSFIQLLGLDEKGMASLYSDVMIESNKMKQSERGHKIKKGGDSQQIINKPTFQEEKAEPDIALSVTESYLFQSKGKPDTQAYIAQYPTDLEQLVKNQDSGDFAKEAETKPKIEKDVSKHDRKELEFYKIKGMLERGLRDNYDFIMKMPMLGSVCVGLLAEGKDLPRNFTNLYLCLIDKLLGGHESLSGGKGEKCIEHFDLFLPYEKVHRHVETLRKLGKIAYNSIFSAASQLVNYKTLDRYLEETEIEFANRTGLLVSVQTLTGEASDEQNVRCVHKSIQDSLVSIYIVMEKEEAFDSFCQQLTSMNVIIDVSHVIMMVCGLNPNLGCRMTRSIKDVLDKDNTVWRHRIFQMSGDLIRELYKLQLRWYTEYIDTETNIGSIRKDSFYVSDIYVDNDTDKYTVTKTIVLLSDKNVIVTSLYVNDVPAESGLSDKVLNDFLALNTSALESLYVRRAYYRSIEPLSLPVLTVLNLGYVHIRPASTDDEATKPLLYHLPMLQRLHLYNIELNNRLLGLTSIEGRMPMLKGVYITAVDMSDQSIELASDMRDIEDIQLVSVKMSPPGWIKFIRSLVNIHHSYRVMLNRSDIDAQSLDMVRTDKNFEMKGISGTSFIRVWPPT